MEGREQARAELSTVMARVVERGEVESVDRLELRRIFRMAVLTVSDVKEVLGTHLKTLASQLQGDLVQEVEMERCKNIIAELRIPLRLLPPDVLDVVIGRRRSS